MSDDVRFDWQRRLRSGIPEAVFAQGKSIVQLEAIAVDAIERQQRILMTRVSAEQGAAMFDLFGQKVQWHELARTLVVGANDVENLLSDTPHVAIVAAGTSDLSLVAEIEQCLHFLGVQSSRFMDVGVAGLWRLTDIAEELRGFPVVVAVAGMEGALFSVVAGLVNGPVVAVPSSVGYGVSAGGYAALNCALSSCAPGIAVVNVDNGFGAAALVVKMLGVSVVD